MICATAKSTFVKSAQTRAPSLERTPGRSKEPEAAEPEADGLAASIA